MPGGVAMSLAVRVGLLGATLMIGAPTRAGEPPRTGNDEDAKLEAFFKHYLEETFRARPMAATRLGDHRFDDRLDDLSPEARKASLERDKQALADLPGAVDVGKLSPDGRVDYEVLHADLERSVWLQETFDPFRDDPRVWGEYLTESVYVLLTQSTLPRETNLKNALERMKQIPRVVETARRTIGDPPRVMTETAILQTKGAIGFYEDEIYTLAGAEKGDTDIAGRAQPIIDALNEHLKLLESDVLPRSQDEGWRIGREKFDRKFALELDAGITADEALAEARSEAERVEEAMAVIARQLWGTMFPGEPIPPDDDAGRRALIGRVLARIGDDRSTSASMLEDVTATVAEIKEFIRERHILALPDPDRCAIIEMPEFMRGNSTAYLNPAPPLDPGGRSEYAVSPPPASWTEDRVESYFREYNKSMLKILSIHEGYPGHYVQLEYSNRCPSFIRRVLGSGTFAEGWAVYTEQMMLDQGFGDGDPRLRMMQLKFYLRAVVNAILDHEMHCGDMTDDQAMELLVGRAFQTEGEAVGKIRRAKQSSVQLSTYFVGRTAFHRLRRDIQRAQGDRFDLSAYHEAALGHGTVPVKHLPALVRRSLGMEER
jgi:uncharacterized protein (DUF885 family)